jgi:hypothetical protein
MAHPRVSRRHGATCGQRDSPMNHHARHVTLDGDVAISALFVFAPPHQGEARAKARTREREERRERAREKVSIAKSPYEAPNCLTSSDNRRNQGGTRKYVPPSVGACAPWAGMRHTLDGRDRPPIHVRDFFFFFFGFDAWRVSVTCGAWVACWRRSVCDFSPGYCENSRGERSTNTFFLPLGFHHIGWTGRCGIF